MADPLDGTDFFRTIQISRTITFDPQSNPLMSVTLTTFPGLRYSFQTNESLQNLQGLSRSAFNATNYTTSREVLLCSDRDLVRAKRE